MKYKKKTAITTPKVVEKKCADILWPCLVFGKNFALPPQSNNGAQCVWLMRYNKRWFVLRVSLWTVQKAMWKVNSPYTKVKPQRPSLKVATGVMHTHTNTPTNTQRGRRREREKPTITVVACATCKLALSAFLACGCWLGSLRFGRMFAVLATADINEKEMRGREREREWVRENKLSNPVEAGEK